MPLARVQEKSRTDLRRRCKELGVSYRGDDGPAALAAKIQYAEQSSQTQQQNAGARTEEPSSQITAVRASPPVGLDTHRSKPIVSTCPKRRRISTPPTKQPQSPGLCPSTARSAADELASAQGQEQPKGQGGIEKHSTAGTFRAYVKRKGYKGIGPYRAAWSAANEDRRILCDASAQGSDALRVASQRLLREAADMRVPAEVSQAHVNIDPLHVRPVRPRPSCPETFSPGPSRPRVSRP